MLERIIPYLLPESHMSSSPAIIDSDATVWPLHGAVIKSHVYVKMLEGNLVAVNKWHFQISAFYRKESMKLMPDSCCV